MTMPRQSLDDRIKDLQAQLNELEIKEVSFKQLLASTCKALEDYLATVANDKWYRLYTFSNADIASHTLKQVEKIANSNKNDDVKKADLILLLYRSSILAYNKKSTHLAPKLIEIFQSAIHVEQIPNINPMNAFVEAGKKWFEINIELNKLRGESQKNHPRPFAPETHESKLEEVKDSPTSKEKKCQIITCEFKTDALIQHIIDIQGSKVGATSKAVNKFNTFKIDGEMRGQAVRIFTCEHKLSEDAKKICDEMSSWLKAQLSSLSLLIIIESEFDKQTIQLTRQLTDSLLDTFKNHEKWSLILEDMSSEPNKEAFKKYVCSPLIFKLLADLFTKKQISKNMFEYVKIVENSSSDEDATTALNTKFPDKQKFSYSPPPSSGSIFPKPTPPSPPELHLPPSQIKPRRSPS